MKKIILTALTVLMIFGLIGCSGVLHDTPVPVNEPVKIDGASWYSIDITVWGNNSAEDAKPSNIIFNNNNNGKQTVDTKLPAFEAAKGAVFYYTLDATKPNKEGKYELNVAYQDDNPAYTVKPGVVRVYVYTNMEDLTAYIWDDEDAPFEKSASWPGSAVALAGVEAGTPFYLHGFFVPGLGEGDDTWKCTDTTVLSNPTTDLYGNVEYSYNFTATGTEMEFGIAANGSWNPKYVNATFTVGTDKDFVKTERLESGGVNNKIKGLKIGTPYRIVVKTTPEKEVYFSVEEICKVTFTFEVTNMGENTDAWMNGTFWGNWSNGWKQESWYKDNSSNKFNDKLTAPTVADGVATFDDKWNVVKVAKPNDVLKFSFKTQVTKDDWSNDSKCSSPDNDQTLEFKVTKSGTVKVSVNASDWKVTAKYVD